MSFLQLCLIALSLAMDAFAVSVCKGLNMKTLSLKKAAVIAGFFGVFQGIMPLIGWALGRGFKHYIMAFDHWIAFILLAAIGGKMIHEALKGDSQPKCSDEGGVSDRLSIKELFTLAIATSIDALAVGIALGLLPEVNIGIAAITIALITFVLSFAGVVIGKGFGGKLQGKAEILGGLCLILIGLKILLEHLGVQF